MKRTVALILCGCLLLVLCACRNHKDADEEELSETTISENFEENLDLVQDNQSNNEENWPNAENRLPKLGSFERLMTNAVTDFYQSIGRDTQTMDYVLKGYEINDMREPGAAYEYMLSCEYSPGIGLIGNANNGNVEYVFTFIAGIGTNILDGEGLAATLPTLMIPVALFDDNYTGAEALLELMTEIVQNGIQEEKDGHITKELTINNIEYTIYFSDAMLGFTVDAQGLNSNNDADYMNGHANEELNEFLNMASGIWVDKSSYYDGVFTFCSIKDGMFYTAEYCGEMSRPMNIVDVVQPEHGCYTLSLYSGAGEFAGDYYDDELYYECTLIFDGQTLVFPDNPETVYTYMGTDLENAVSAVEAAIGEESQTQTTDNTYDASVLSGNHTYTGTMIVDGLSAYLELDSPITYQDPLDNEPITSAELWLSESDVSFFSGYNGLTVTLEGVLFNYRGGGTLMFDGTPAVVSVSGTPEVPAPSGTYQNWDSTDNETIFWDALEVLRTIIYRCEAVWDVRTLCDDSALDGISTEGFSIPIMVMLSINDNWIEDYGYCAYIAPEEDGVVIEIDIVGDSAAEWKYSWTGELMSGDGTLEEYIMSQGLV